MGCVTSQQNQNPIKNHVYQDRSQKLIRNNGQISIEKGKDYRSIQDKNRIIQPKKCERRHASQSTTQQKKQLGQKVSPFCQDKITPQKQKYCQKVQQTTQGFLQKTERLKQSILRSKVKNIDIIHLNDKNEIKEEKQKMDNSSMNIALEIGQKIGQKTQKVQTPYTHRIDTSASSHDSSKQNVSEPNQKTQSQIRINRRRNFSTASGTRSPIGKPTNLFKTFKDDKIELENQDI